MRYNNLYFLLKKGQISRTERKHFLQIYVKMTFGGIPPFYTERKKERKRYPIPEHKGVFP